MSTARLLAVVAVAMLGAGGCSSSDPLADYLAEARQTGGTEAMTDGQLILSGQMVCHLQAVAPADAAATFGEAPEEFVQLALDNCDVLNSLTPQQRQRYGLDAGGPAPSTQPGGPGTDPETGFSPRGNQVTQVGETIESYGPPMSTAVGQRVTVSKIEKVENPNCTAVPGYRPEQVAPENGAFWAVTMEVVNTPEYDASQGGYYPGGSRWDFVAADGRAFDDVVTTAAATAAYCAGVTDSGGPFPALKPGRSYSGTIYVDLPETPGYLILGQGAGTVGYEFEIK